MVLGCSKRKWENSVLRLENIMYWAQAPKIPVYDVFNDVREYQEEMTLNAKAAAEVAKKHALDFAKSLRLLNVKDIEELYEQWLKDNGITE